LTLLIDHWFTQEDPTPSTKQRQYATAGKENGQEPKPRFQRQEKYAAAATKGKPEDKTSRPAQSFVPVRQELSSDCGSEDGKCANMAWKRGAIREKRSDSGKAELFGKRGAIREKRSDSGKEELFRKRGAIREKRSYSEIDRHTKGGAIRGG
jgi:hypothetical protein